MSKLWTHCPVLIGIFLLGLLVGRSGLVPTPAQADASLEGGDPSGFYWNETEDSLDLFNFSPDETFIALAELKNDEAWQALGDSEVIHQEGTVTVKTEGLTQVTVYRLAGVATKAGPELIRPCLAPPIDCPAPGRPPVPPRQKFIVIHTEPQ